MRILYITREYTPHDHRFLSALAGSDHQIYALRLENCGNHLEQRALPDSIQPIIWRNSKGRMHLCNYPAYINELKQVINILKPDLIHAGPIQSAAFISALCGFKPLVSMSWGSDLLVDADKNMFMKQATRFTLKKSTILVGDCLAVKDKAISFKYPEERIVLFPWGVDLNHFSPAKASIIRKKIKWENDFVLLSLRTWEPIYGVDIIVKAFIQAAAYDSRIKLILLGSGSQEKYLHRLLEESDLLSRVYLGGRVSNQELPDFYRAADLYISASHSDGSSVSLLEALACGCPVLVSDIPGNLEWVKRGEQGWLFPDGDDKALAKAMINALEQRDMLTTMAAKARDTAEKRADWSRNFQKLLYAYERAINLTT